MRLAHGATVCCGSNDRHQLSDADLGHAPLPVTVDTVHSVTAMSAGPNHTCIVDDRGELWCWGDETPVWSRSLRPARSWGPSPGIVEVGVGVSHACGRDGDGALACWGIRNGNGQLGIGSRELPAGSTPVSLPGGNAVQLAVGGWHSCALAESGALWCWGRNETGQVGVETGAGEEGDVLAPELVMREVVDVVAGYGFTCALLESRDVYCWGDNTSGQIGIGETGAVIRTPMPVRLPSGISITDIGAGADGHFACALTASGRVLCWGANGDAGTLGTGESNSHSSLPVEVVGVDDAVQLDVGSRHACVIREGGDLWCWGTNGDGQLCDGTMVTRLTPTRALVE